MSRSVFQFLVVIFLSFFLLPFNTVLAQSNDEIKRSIERMSLEEIVDFIQNFKETTSTGVFTSLTQRLYQIAYYENHIPPEKRELAIRLLEEVKKTLKEAIKNNPKALKAYQEANQYVEKNIIKLGYGSLAWLIKENRVQDKDVISFIMKPEYGHLLSELLNMMDEDALRKIKPYLLKNLILLRQPYSYVENSVLTGYGLILKKDPAAFAVFSNDEIKTILNTSKDYQESRIILVKYGLLPKLSKSRPFMPKPKNKMLAAFILLSSDFREGAGKNNFWKEDLEIKAFYDNLGSEEEKPFLEITLLAQRIFLWFDLINDIYGETVYEKIKNDIFDLLGESKELYLNDWFKAFKVAERNYNPQMGVSFDALTTYSLMFLEGLIKNSDILSKRNEQLLQGYAKILNRDRIEALDQFRFYLRFLASPTSDSDAEINEKELKNLIERYVDKGSFSDGLEYPLYMEDFIGLDTLN